MAIHLGCLQRMLAAAARASTFFGVSCVPQCAVERQCRDLALSAAESPGQQMAGWIDRGVSTVPCRHYAIHIFIPQHY